MPVAYIPRTRELYKSYGAYRWVVNESAPPWTPLSKPLRRVQSRADWFGRNPLSRPAAVPSRGHQLPPDSQARHAG